MNTPTLKPLPTRMPPLTLLVGLLVALALLLTPVAVSRAQHATPAASPIAPVDAEAGAGVAPHLHAGARTTPHVPGVNHVFVINIENKGYDETWGPTSPAPYLSRTLRAKGVLLDHYYGTAHNSQPNYVAQISGQGPNIDMQADCQRFSNFTSAGTAPFGQLRGSGCVFPASVPTLPGQLTHRHRTWKGYMDDMDSSCEHPAVGSSDGTQKARVGHQYATRHNPFSYFHSIIDDQRYCARHVVSLTRLTHDLRTVTTTPNLSYITPDLCDDGHDAPCVDGRPGGLRSVDAWMRVWVPRILRSPAFRRDGMLVITADESDGPQEDATACCDEQAVNTPMAGIAGAGGGKIGALVIAPRWIRGGTFSTTPYNHYSLLGSLEEVFGLAKLGYARVPGLAHFGLDVYNNGWNEKAQHPKTHHPKHHRRPR